MKAFLGIDPGLKGGLAIIRGQEVTVVPMPANGAELDLNAIKSFISTHGPIDFAVIEKVGAMPKQGSVSGFKFGKVAGMLEAMVVAFGIPYSLVRPQEWQKQMLQGTNSKDDTKTRGIQVCGRVFPSVSLLATSRSYVPHDGMSDALLMAEYCRRNHG